MFVLPAAGDRELTELRSGCGEAGAVDVLVGPGRVRRLDDNKVTGPVHGQFVFNLARVRDGDFSAAPLSDES